ncbi:MAG: phosphoenolpyruvate--protein phosphotransferase [Betaproteobacteria bacterium]|jgi:phosphotransferase system enzyme I (PtsI)|nr:phosphoenolpyruvate--protein phosphotransferase [Betaproteobacteria bacterium]MDH5341271.1 phosphoenolpyruvate--protein phosphotransferase [Betaproteobacteria bacterium]
MSFTIHGIGVSGGIAIGHAHLVSHTKLEAAHYDIPAEQVTEEIARFERAVHTVRNELDQVRSVVPAGAPAEFAAFIDLHLMILNDATLSITPRKIIETENCNAEWALQVQTDELLQQFDAIEDTYLRERRTDVIQVAQRVMKALSGQPGYVPPPASDSGRNLVLVAHDLSPADVVLFKQHQFASFVTDLGGATSHTAIVARSLNIPCIVALHHARQLVRENEIIIVDGTQGVIIVDPDPQVLAEYQLRQREFGLERQKLKRLRDTPARTLDGTDIELHANIELPGDVALAIDSGATGIGLFRTEFLFLNRPDLPTEDEQFEAYRMVLEEMQGYPVTIRTYDLGADKQIDDTARLAPNPALGLRAIRLCLTEPKRFVTQLRAMLRASSYGSMKILIPMLMNASEIDQALQLVEQAKRSLDDEGVTYDRDVQIGGMVEIPAAALALGLLTKRLDFLSVGTNDLIQYMLAVDRTDDTVAHLYDPLHPAVLTLLSHIFTTAGKAQIPVAVCGEMAGDVTLTRLLLALGLRRLSMHSAHLPDVKQRVLKTSLPDIRPIAKKMLKATDPVKLRSMLDKLNA